jgi:hypothetical protein
MRTLWRGIKNTVFWSYQRGTWPYDLLVIGIVAFVLLSPRAWFNDRPAVAHEPASAGVQVLSEDSDQGLTMLRLDASLLTQPKPDPAFERRAHDFLGKHVDALKGKTFQIKEIRPVRQTDGTTLYYEVVVKH